MFKLQQVDSSAKFAPQMMDIQFKIGTAVANVTVIRCTSYSTALYLNLILIQSCQSRGCQLTRGHFKPTLLPSEGPFRVCCFGKGLGEANPLPSPPCIGQNSQ